MLSLLLSYTQILEVTFQATDFLQTSKNPNKLPRHIVTAELQIHHTHLHTTVKAYQDIMKNLCRNLKVAANLLNRLFILINSKNTKFCNTLKDTHEK